MKKVACYLKYASFFTELVNNEKKSSNMIRTLI